MRVRIHRGADEIGGSCVEVEHNGSRLVLDVGRPLTAQRGEFVPLPPVPGLAAGDPSILGVLISHGHQDHWGLIDQVHPSIPRFIGKGAADVLRAAKFWGAGIDLNESGHFQDREPFQLEPFTVTPYLVDHSGFDAYALVVEADGERLMYSGDLRGHGRKARMFERLVSDPPRDIDALLLEGTHVGAPTDVHGLASESVVEDRLADVCAETEGAVVVLNSAQNIDRLVTCFRAALRSDRDLVVDLYTAEVLAATGRSTLPVPGPAWPRVKVLVPVNQRVRVRDSTEFDRVRRVRADRVFNEQIAAQPRRYLIAGAYQSEIARMSRGGLLECGLVVWSMWGGYQSEYSGQRLIETLSLASVPMIELHTSGHANLVDLGRLVRAIAPTSLVPIHTDHPEAYGRDLNATFTMHVDGRWWDVRSPKIAA